MTQLISLSDKPLFDRYQSRSGERTVEFGFSSLYIWAHKFKLGHTVWKDWLLACEQSTGSCWLMPFGPPDCRDAVLRCMELHGECYPNRPFCVTAVTERGKGYLESAFPQRFHFTEMPERADYLYNTADLASLTGKRYHGKRNHINRFHQLYGDRSGTEPITEENLPEIWAFEKVWRRKKTETNGQPEHTPHVNLEDEAQALRRLLPNLKALGGKGRLLRVDGQVVAFTAGAPVGSDTIDIQCEKAAPNIEGAYQVINQLFAKHDCADFLYINREEDMGLPGLRKAKASYYPVDLLKKYRARWI